MKLVKLIVYKHHEITVNRSTDMTVQTYYNVTITSLAWTQDAKRKVVSAQTKVYGQIAELVLKAKEQVDFLTTRRENHVEH